jgi:chemotaxis protein methyltransferase CheR
MAAYIGINELKDITGALSDKTGYPFNDFSQSFLKRRLHLFFDKFHIRHTDQLTKQLGSKLFIESLLYHLSVDTTEMFRDPGFWRTIKTHIHNNPSLLNFPVWFPDIASGEELYSFLILLKITLPNSKAEVIFHHPSSSRIDEIKTGMLRSKNIEIHDSNFKRLELNDGNFESFFRLHNNYLTLHENVLGKLHPKKGWFLTEPDASNFGMIFYRNSMLYQNRNLQERTCKFLVDHLAPGGILVIGIKETLPDSILSRMQVIDEQERIFRKP